MECSASAASGQAGPLKLLSLDGGGVRGLSSLIVLKHLMKRANPRNSTKPCEYFDLIGGTSTGGLIAIMLGRLEMDIDACIDAYLELSSAAFQRKRHNANFFGRGNDAYHVKGTYSSEGLEKVVRELVKSVAGDSEAKLVSSSNQCQTFVCAFTKAGNTPVLIRSYTHDTAVEPLSISGCTIWQAARATSAAAMFFDPIKIGNQEYVDRATGFNNPVELVLEEAKSIWPDATTRIQCILSIGTGVPDLKDFGDNMKEVIDTLKAISTETEETANRFFKNHRQFGLENRYFRFNVQQGLANVELDEHKKVDKIESATERYLGLPEIKEKADGFVTARPPNALPPLTREAKDNLLRWLKFIDTSDLHCAAREKRTQGTGEWFITGHFDDWAASSHSILWLYGKAGCGKSVLCSNVVDQIGEQSLGSLAYFNFTFRRNEPQDLRNLMHSLLTQLVRSLVRRDKQDPQRFYVPRAFQELYEKYVFESTPKVEDLQETFLHVLAEPKATYIVIDALDECPLISDRCKILKFLAKVASISTNAHILVTSRQQEDIQNVFNEISLPARVIQIPIQNPEVNLDIHQHVKSCLNEDPQFKKWADNIKTEVLDYLVDHANGVFKWVECQLVTLGTKKRKLDILKTLKELPKDLDETYARMMASINSSGYEKEAHAVLQWLAFSNRPLTISEAAEAAVINQEIVELSSEAYPTSFDPKLRFPNEVDIQNILSQLVIVSGNGQISFAHFSVKEYLTCDRVEARYKIVERLAHRFILESCLVYIQSYFDCRTVHGVEDSKGFPLLDYSCKYWPGHARETFAANVQTQHTDNLIVTLFQGSKNLFISSLEISSSGSNVQRCLFRSDTEFASPAWFLAYHNLEYILQLLQNSAEVTKLGIELKFDGFVALHIAAEKGYDAVVSILLDMGAEIEAKDHDGQTALHLASSAGYDSLVHLLLDRSANIIARNLDKRTPLHVAAMEGRMAVLEELISSVRMRKKDLEIRDLYGLTALHLAVRFAEWRGASGEAPVRKLLESGANANSQSYSGKTIAQDAADYGNLPIQTLLEKSGCTVHINASTKPDEPIFNEAWKTMRASISKSLWGRYKQGDVETFIATHNVLHGYCQSIPAANENGPKIHARRGRELVGRSVYISLDEQIQDILTEISSALSRVSLDERIDVYVRELNHYFKSAKRIKSMFKYLDNHWIKKEMEEGDKNIFEIHDLLFLRWKEKIVDQDQQTIPLILKGFQKLRNGEAVEITPFRAILDSFRDIDDTIIKHGIRLKVYQNIFEKPFMNATREYYQAKLDQDFANGTDEEYMELVKRYQAEELHKTQGLGFSTKSYFSTEELIKEMFATLKPRTRN